MCDCLVCDEISDIKDGRKYIATNNYYMIFISVVVDVINFQFLLYYYYYYYYYILYNYCGACYCCVFVFCCISFVFAFLHSRENNVSYKSVTLTASLLDSSILKP